MIDAEPFQQLECYAEPSQHLPTLYLVDIHCQRSPITINAGTDQWYKIYFTRMSLHAKTE